MFYSLAMSQQLSTPQALSAKTRRGERESRAKDDQEARFEVSGGQMGLV